MQRVRSACTIHDQLNRKCSKVCKEQPRAPGQIQFAIVQGGEFADLRAECAKGLVEMDFEGYAIGGVSVGEPDELILPGVEASVALLPETKARYLMGVGMLDQMIEAIARGVDMFDCVLPTRVARNGTAITRKGRYAVKNAVWKESDRPIEDGCTCYTCRNFSRGYIRHLINCDEILGHHLLTLHNLSCMQQVIDDVRKSIQEGRFTEFRRDFLSNYNKIAVDP